MTNIASRRVLALLATVAAVVLCGSGAMMAPVHESRVPPDQPSSLPLAILFGLLALGVALALRAYYRRLANWNTWNHR